MNFHPNRLGMMGRNPQGIGSVKPIHVQRLEKAFELGPFLSHVQATLNKNYER